MVEETNQLKNMKERLKRFIDQSKIFDVIPISSNLVAISDEFNLNHFLEILDENLTLKALILNKKNENVQNILLVVDLINVLIYMSKEKPDILEDKEKIEKFLNEVTIADVIEKFGIYKKNIKKEIISLKISDKLIDALEIFRSEKIGNIVIRTSLTEKEYFSILTKNEFLLYILRNYRASSSEKNFFELKIKDLNIDIIRKEKDTLFIQEDEKLSKAFDVIKENEVF